MHVSSLGDSALVVHVAPDAAADDLATIDAVRRVAARLGAASLPGVIDVAAASATVTLWFDPVTTAPETIARSAADLLALPPATVLPPARTVTIPVCYGGDHGPDLAGLAARAGMTEAEVVRRHAAAEYRVALLGFLPGFPYLVGLPAELAAPRLATPRQEVPAGSVGIAGTRSGVYPRASPGGWQLIGRTPLDLFTPDRDPPTLLASGDLVRFTPIDGAAFTRLAGEREHGR